MSTILEKIEGNMFGYDKRLHIKGAAEIVLKGCTHYLDKSGLRVELPDEMKEELGEVITGYAK